MFEKILFTTDLSFGWNGIVAYVLELARGYQSKVFAMHVKTSEWGELQKAEAHSLKNRLADVPHEILIKEGEIRDHLLQFAEREGIDLIVTGTHGRTGIGRVLLGSVAEALLREASCPVMTVGPGTWGKDPRDLKLAEILYATDLTPASAAANTVAFSIAQTNRSRLTILNIQPHIPAGTHPESLETMETLRRLERLVPKEPALSLAPYFVVEAGDAAEQIVKNASKYKADLIVMGSRQLPVGMATHITQTTAHRVIVEANCPVLTVGDAKKRGHEHARSKDRLKKEVANATRLFGA